MLFFTSERAEGHSQAQTLVATADVYNSALNNNLLTRVVTHASPNATRRTRASLSFQIYTRTSLKYVSVQ